MFYKWNSYEIILKVIDLSLEKDLMVFLVDIQRCAVRESGNNLPHLTQGCVPLVSFPRAAVSLALALHTYTVGYCMLKPVPSYGVSSCMCCVFHCN